MTEPRAGEPAEDILRARLMLFAWASFAGLLAAMVFVGWPEIDLAVSRLFFDADGAFVFNHPGMGPAARMTFRLISWIGAGTVVLGMVLALTGRRLFGVRFIPWLFAATCLIVGPGLVANVLLKDNWGRPRPMHVEQFGGPQSFTTALARSDHCERNCSFIGGEAAAIYSLFFGLALIARRRRRMLLAIGIVGGTLAGVVRIAQGGHFLSDIVFAGVFMALTAAAMHWIVFGLARWARMRGWLPPPTS